MKQKMNLFKVLYNYGHNEMTYICLVLIIGTICIDVYDVLFNTSISYWNISVITYIISVLLIIGAAYLEKYIDEMDSKYIIKDYKHYNRTHRKFKK